MTKLDKPIRRELQIGDQVYTLTIGPTNASHLRIGYDREYSWVQSHGAKPLALNPIGNNVGI